MKKEHSEKRVWVGKESGGMIGGEEAVAQTLIDKGDGLRNKNRARIIEWWERSENEGQRWVEATLIFFMTYLCSQAWEPCLISRWMRISHSFHPISGVSGRYGRVTLHHTCTLCVSHNHVASSWGIGRWGEDWSAVLFSSVRCFVNFRGGGRESVDGWSFVSW